MKDARIRSALRDFRSVPGWVRLACAGWVGLVASIPWIIRAFPFADLTGVTVLLGFLVLGSAPALVFGFLLGSVRACSLLAVSAVAGSVAFLIDWVALAAFSGPAVRTEAFWGAWVFTYLFFLVLFIEIPLVAGTSFGMVCWRWRSERAH